MLFSLSLYISLSLLLCAVLYTVLYIIYVYDFIMYYVSLSFVHLCWFVCTLYYWEGGPKLSMVFLFRSCVFFAPPKHKLHSCYGIAYVSSSWMVVGCGIKQIFGLHRMGGSMFGPIIRGPAVPKSTETSTFSENNSLLEKFPRKPSHLVDFGNTRVHWQKRTHETHQNPHV